MTTTSTTLLKAIGADADSPRWVEFVARYQPVMESFLKSQFPDVDADDVMQETLIVLARKLPEYHYAPDTKGHFRNYLIGIMKNKAREAQKSHLKLNRVETAAKELAEASSAVSALESALSSGNSGEIRNASDRLESVLNAAGAYTTPSADEQDDGAYDA